MNELNIRYGRNKAARLGTAIIGAYLSVFCLYFTIMEVTASRFEVLFYCSLIGTLFAIILLLANTLFSTTPVIKINSDTIEINIPSQSKLNIEWTSVSQVSIGASYFVFLLNGKKQQKLDISTLTYTDLMDVKSKIIELSEHKSIPYKND